MDIRKIIQEAIDDIWFHGTPDAREVEKEGGFTQNKEEITYIEDIDGHIQLQAAMQQARDEDNEEEYLRLLDMVRPLKKEFSYIKPVFLTDKTSVARTYADPERAFDYQNAKERIFRVKVKDGKRVVINAHGDRFRFIDIVKVKNGFVDAGISPEEFDRVAAMFTWWQQKKKSIKTDAIGALGHWFKFDIIDVKGVLDSYEGGSVRSTVRMVLDPKDVTIIS